MKNKLYSLMIAASLPIMVQTASAQVLFSDNYTATSNQTPNDQINNPGRQSGPLAPLGYIQTGNVQIGNLTTLPLDPGDVSAGDSFLAAFGGTAYINYDFSIATGPLEIDFSGVVSHIAAHDQTDWISFNVGAGAGAPFINNSAVCSILFRANGGIELWNQGSNTDPSGGFAPGFDAWTSYKVILSDTAGTGSAFVGNGSRADYYSNGSFIGTFNMNQLSAGQGFIGFSGSQIVGYDNVTIKGTLPAVIAPVLMTDVQPRESQAIPGQSLTLSVHVTGTPLNYQWYNQNGAISGATTNSYTFNALAGTNSYYVIVANTAGSVTSSTASVIGATNIVPVNNYSFENGSTPHYGNGALPTGWTSFNDDWAGLGTSGGGFDAPDGNTFFAVNTGPSHSGASGIYQDVGALMPNTTYTLTVAVGRSTANGVPPNGAGDWSPGIISLLNGTDGTGTLEATTTGYPDAVGTWQDYTATFSTGPTPSGDLVITLSDAPASTYQATFDNVRLTYAHSSVPLPVRIQDTAPASASVALGSNAVFTAAFSNSPPVTLQWQKIKGNVTNNVNTGVVNVTNNGVVTSTLTINNAQLADSGSYRLEAFNATNIVTFVFTTPAALTVVPTITWYAAGAYNYGFADASVLALAGSVANEVYGVDFGGVGLQTTDNGNGYAFNDYANSGNLSIAGTPTTFGGYLNGGGSTGDGALDAVLANGVYGGPTMTATLNNLTVGQTYTVMVLLADTRSPGAGGSTFHVTDGVTTSPAQQYAYAFGTPKVGGYIMGTFTAQATTQPLSVFNDSGYAQYNAILLEKGVAAPPTNAPILASDLPLESRVAAGVPFTLSITAVGAVPLHYQWFDQNGSISGATNSTYSFNPATGTSSYHVTVTNAYGATNSSTGVVVSSTNIVTVQNFSFENGSTPHYGNGALPTGWTAFNDDWAGLGTSGGGFDAPDGTTYFAVNTGPGHSGASGIYQDVGALLPNTTYTLTVAIGRSTANGVPPNGAGDWSPGIISLLNGTNSSGTLEATTTGYPGAVGTWQDYTATFTTGPSTSGDLVITLSDAPANTYQATFDNVRLTKETVSVAIAPILGPITISGGNLIVTGIGGTANAGYTWLSTTNLTPPITWTTNSTGTLDANGAFSNTIPISASQKSGFFKLRLP